MTGPARSSLADRLGHSPDAKLLIVHADDLGLSHSANAASIRALESGGVNSVSVMVPCPGFEEIAAWITDHPAYDVGIHGTLTNERKGLRWGPLLGARRVPSLVDERGHLLATCEEFAKRADPDEAFAELRAQVELARARGIRPTHLDTHMGSVFFSVELFDAYLRVGREFGLPVFAPRPILELVPALSERLAPGEPAIDHVVMAPRSQVEEELPGFYAEALGRLAPGVTQWIVHLAFDDAEMRAIAVDHPHYGASWRQRDLEFTTGETCRHLLAEQGAIPLTWREIGAGKPG